VKAHSLCGEGICFGSPDDHVAVTRHLKDEFDNGNEYHALQGKRILVPDEPALRHFCHREHVMGKFPTT